MTKDAEKLLKYIVDKSKTQNNSVKVDVLIDDIENIPNIRFAKNKLLHELEEADVISGCDTSEHGEVQVYLTTDGLEYFDALENDLKPTSVFVNVSGGDCIASKKVETINNKIENNQDSSQKKINENVNKNQCNTSDNKEDKQGHRESVSNNNNETVAVDPEPKIWGKYLLLLLLLSICVLITGFIVIIPDEDKIFAIIDFFDGEDKQITILDDLVVSQNTIGLRIPDEYITEDAIKQLNKLEYLTELTFERCNFEDDALSTLSLPLEYFCMTDCTNVTSCYFLANMDNLHELKLQNCGITDDKIPLLMQGGISSICIADNVEFTNLSVLSLSNLLNLDFSGTSVYDLLPLSICENLIQINGSNTLVSDLKPLANLEKLTTMQFDHCAIQEIKDEFMSLRMRNISFECNSITDCSGFSNFTILENVNFSNNKLSEISWLEKSKETLNIVALSNNLLEEEHISFLNECKSLQEVYLNGIQMSSLNIIKNMQKLKKIEAVHCGIKDISALEGMSELEYIHLAQNEIIDISALKEMGSQTAEFDLACNNITNISYLPQESNLLVLFGNPISLNKNNFGQMSGNIIVMDYKQDMLNYSINFQDIYIVNCPMDKRVKLENALKCTHFVTQEEAFQMLETEYNIHYK